MKTKNLIVFFLCTLLVFQLCACTSNKGKNMTSETTANVTENGEQTNEPIVNPSVPEDENKMFLNVNTAGIKLLDDRMELLENGITCDWSCAGIEFLATCDGKIKVDVQVTAENGCNFRVYVDGAEWKNGSSPYYATTPGMSSFEITGIPEGEHLIRIVKVTGYTLARSTLCALTLNGSLNATAPEKKDTFIEFIGDSMFCGWGVVKTASGKYNGTVESQDGTLAVPYLFAQRMDADYSVVAVSGQGVAYGNPNIENAYQYASYARSKATAYTPARQADIVVINVGTNDYSHRETVTETMFAEAFERLVKNVREKNGEDCIILAMRGMMNDTYGNQIESVFAKLGGASKNYYTLQMNKVSGLLCSHPSASENVGYEQVLYEAIKVISETSEPGGTLTVEEVNSNTSPIPTIRWSAGTEKQQEQ